MKDGNLNGKIHSSMYHQCQERGYATPVDVLMEIGVLPKRSMRIGGLGELHIWRVSAPLISESSLLFCIKCVCMQKRQD